MIALAIATIILGLSPGPAVFATIARSLTLGLSSTYLFILGIILGDLCFSLLAMLGLSTLAMIHMPLFLCLKIIGGGYLIYLGIKSLRDSKTPDLNFSFQEKGCALVTSGFFLTASNPKDLLFFVGFLPLFVDLEQASTINVVTASFVVVLSFLVTLSFYAVLANSACRFFKSSLAIRRLYTIAGTLMTGAGIAVIVL